MIDKSLLIYYVNYNAERVQWVKYVGRYSASRKFHNSIRSSEMVEIFWKNYHVCESPILINNNVKNFQLVWTIFGKVIAKEIMK